MKLLSVFTALAVLLGVSCQTTPKLKLTAVTTAGCSDTVAWIQNQFRDVYLRYGQHIDLEFVPWGRTRRDADGSLVCQFAEADCWANRLHRCALHMLNGNQAAQAQYMDCEFKNFDDRPAFLQQSYACARSVGLLDWRLDPCMQTSLGDRLGEEAEAKAALPMQVINFVPAVYLNETPSWNVFVMAFTDLNTLVCNTLLQQGNISTC